MPANDPSTAYVSELTRALGQRGLDLCHPFRLSAALDDLFPFPRFGHKERLGCLIGNTRALWPHFVSWYAEDEQHAALAHPLQSYLERVVDESRGEASCVVFHSHRVDYPTKRGPSAVPIQRLGQRVGFAALGPAYLSAHVRYGPWFAYRAVLAVDLPPLPPARTPQPVASDEMIAPCRDCSAPCHRALERVLRQTPADSVETNWQAWVAVRDSCPVGRAERYGRAQLSYHYRKDRAALSNLDEPRPTDTEVPAGATETWRGERLT